jgi:hypothetical protein
MGQTIRQLSVLVLNNARFRRRGQSRCRATRVQPWPVTVLGEWAKVFTFNHMILAVFRAARLRKPALGFRTATNLQVHMANTSVIDTKKSTLHMNNCRNHGLQTDITTGRVSDTNKRMQCNVLRVIWDSGPTFLEYQLETPRHFQSREIYSHFHANTDRPLGITSPLDRTLRSRESGTDRLRDRRTGISPKTWSLFWPLSLSGINEWYQLIL